MHYTLPTMSTEEKPMCFQSLGNGVYYYNYNIVTTPVYSHKKDNMEGEYVTGYKYTQVRINGTTTVAKCIEAIYKVAKDDLNDKIGRKYQIVKLSETEDIIEEVD